jgi:3-oxoacyl-[acyl-carrier protein] reductase
MTLAGQVAVVTGGGSGIGEAICLRLAAEGALVACLDVDLAGAESTIATAGSGLALAVDVRDSAVVDAAFVRVERELGPVALLVNNAGAIGAAHLQRLAPRLELRRAEEAATGRASTPLDALVRLEDDEWRRLVGVHLDGTFVCTRAAARAMVPRGAGVIVNMASICGIEGCIGHPHYSAAKAGILGFTRSVARELIEHGIRVNAIAPGHVRTPRRVAAEPAEERAAFEAGIPAGRLGEPEEIAGTVVFLASDDAGYFVGATLSPNGGAVTV